MTLVFIDGEFYPREEAKVSVFDHGFLFGDGLFETMRSYQGQVFRMEAHLERLYQGAQVLKLAIPYPKDQVASWIEQTIRKNELTEAYVRLTLTRGVGKPGPDPTTCPQPGLVIMALPLTSYPQEAYTKGWEGTILNVRRNSPEAIPSTLKSMNFLNNILGKLELIEKQLPEGFFLNQEGYLTEGVVSNLFMVAEGEVLTPAVSCGLLPGVTREVVLELCASRGLTVREGKFRPEQLGAAQECFITNSLAEILPICKLDGQKIGQGEPGYITKQLAMDYKNKIKVEGVVSYI